MIAVVAVRFVFSVVVVAVCLRACCGSDGLVFAARMHLAGCVIRPYFVLRLVRRHVCDSPALVCGYVITVAFFFTLFFVVAVVVRAHLL